MKALLSLLMIIASFTAEASIICHTPSMNKVFEVKEKKITFFNEFDQAARRTIASVSSRSKFERKGVTKIVDFENHKHTIHISDMENFSDVDDYIIIKASTGHEVTYPITCEKK